MGVGPLVWIFGMDVWGWIMYPYPETNSQLAPGWLEYDRFLCGLPIFRGKLLVSGSVYIYIIYHIYIIYVYIGI